MSLIQGLNVIFKGTVHPSLQPPSSKLSFKASISINVTWKCQMLRYMKKLSMPYLLIYNYCSLHVTIPTPTSHAYFSEYQQ